MHGGNSLETRKWGAVRRDASLPTRRNTKTVFAAGASACHIWQVGARDTGRPISGLLGPHVPARRVVNIISPLSRAPSRSPPPHNRFRPIVCLPPLSPQTMRC